MCTCCRGMICSFCVRLTLAAVSSVFGALLAWKPKEIIKIQTALYSIFNWRLEPISMEKEIRNMRIIGSALAIFGILSLAMICVMRWSMK